MNDPIISKYEENHFEVYRRFPVAFSHGSGCYLYDFNGNRYLDGLSGIAVNSLGYNHSKLTRAIKEQAERLLHVSNLYYNQPQSELAEKLTSITGYEKVFFCNSGLEANEAAIKLARKYGHTHGKTGKIYSFTNCFHGRSIASITMGKAQYSEGFGPNPEGFAHLPYNDVQALDILDENDIAVFFEAIQGEGGIVPADLQFMDQLQKICRKKNILLVADEIQCGVGRTGKFFGFDHYHVKPDIVSLAKGLGGGIPIGAILADQQVAKCLQPGNHGTTFGGNPLACSAALAVLDAIEEEMLVKGAEEKGIYLLEKLNRLKDVFPEHVEIRGKGLMIGIDFKEPVRPLALELLSAGLLVSATANSVIRLVPPLIISFAEIDELVEILQKTVINHYDLSTK